MLIRTETGYIAGAFDVLGIMKDTSTGRFHACVWEEKPHTEGADTFEGAVAHVAEMRKKIEISDDNVWIKAEQVVLRNFETEGYAEVVAVPNWKLAS